MNAEGTEPSQEARRAAVPGSVLRPTDGEARLLAHRLLRTARYGAIAVLDPESGAPLASRVGVATDLDGAPLILVSLLSAHTKALLADPRCALLVGEPGRGDALAHPRLALSCTAVALAGERGETAQAARRYLNRNPKARLYAGLGDFRWFRLEPGSAMLNGGFGKAYRLTAADILVPTPAGLAALEQEAIDHMNRDHRDATALYARAYAGAKRGNWSLTGLDSEGIDLASGDLVLRIAYPKPLAAASDLRQVLVDMAVQARKHLEEG